MKLVSQLEPNTLQGTEQLAAEKFAEALESLPLALGMNAGFDPIDIRVELREKHGDNETWYGVDVLGNGVEDLLRMGIVQPVSAKEQIIRSATECTCVIPRIDDVIAGGRKGPPGCPRVDQEVVAEWKVCSKGDILPYRSKI